MNSKITSGLLALALFWLTACHKQRISKSASNQSVSDSAVNAYAEKFGEDSSSSSAGSGSVIAPEIKEFAFDYLTAKSKFSFQTKTQNIDNTNVNIRMKKDSIIWISVSGLGLEVARGIITPDSIVFMDKIHKDYFVFTYPQLSKQYNFELNFALLQSVVVGSMPFPRSEDDQVLKENEFFILKQLKDSLLVDNFVNEQNLKLSRLLATEIPTKNTFTLDYQDFKDVNGALFPFSSAILLNVNKNQQVNKTTLEIRHSRVEVVSQNPGFPFSVPSSYKRKK